MIELETLRRRHPWPQKPPATPPCWHGWLHPETGRMLDRRLGPATRVVVELGSWLGLSARHILRRAPAATVICVDLWAAEFVDRVFCDQPEMRAKVRDPHLTFLRNLWDRRQRVVAIRNATPAGLAEIHVAGVQPELIYIDADHRYAGVKADVETAGWLFPDVPLVGDDWGWAGVRRAVEEYAGRSGRTLHENRTAWSIA